MTEEESRQIRESDRESEAETEAGSGGNALLEVVPETQPAPASPSAVANGGKFLRRGRSTKGGADGPLSSVTQGIDLDGMRGHDERGEQIPQLLLLRMLPLHCSEQ